MMQIWSDCESLPMRDARRDATVARVDLRNAVWELASALLLVPLLMVFPQVTARSLLPTIFLAAMVPFLNHFVVTLAAGRLRLTMLAIQASALVLPVPNAAVVGLVSGIVWMRHNPAGNRYLALGTTPFRASLGAAVRVVLAGNYPGAIELSGAAALITVTAHNLLSTGLSISWISDKPILVVWRRALSRTFIAAFAYFALGGILVASVLDGTLRGYALAAIVGLLSVALIETVTEKQTREALEAEVLDHLRYVGHSRVIAGVAHNLRNDIAVARAAFDEISHHPFQGFLKYR